MTLSARNLPPQHRELIEEMASVHKCLPKWVQFYKTPTHLRVLRAAHQISQRQLSKLSGVTQAQIALIEKRRATPGIDTLERLLSALQCDLLLIPRLRRLPEKTLESRAYDKAQRIIARSRAAKGVSDQTIKKLVQAEAVRLLRKPSSSLWDD